MSASRVESAPDGPSAFAHAHPADALVDAVRRCAAPVCVGIDPVAERLPMRFRGEPGSPDAELAAIRAWTRDVLVALATVVPCVKLQSACWERYGAPGVEARDAAIRQARRQGLVVILDAKRGDIGISAEHYAVAAGEAVAFDRAERPEWTTINAWFGRDGLEPFLADGAGAFALVRTSNPGGDEIQAARLGDGSTVAERVAHVVAAVGRPYLGASGYSALGAVVGATHPEDVVGLRERMPEQILLVPGYGAQGGTMATVRACFHPGGLGAIVSASRSVIYAGEADDPEWPAAIGHAAAQFADEVGRAVGLR